METRPPSNVSSVSKFFHRSPGRSTIVFDQSPGKLQIPSWNNCCETSSSQITHGMIRLSSLNRKRSEVCTCSKQLRPTPPQMERAVEQPELRHAAIHSLQNLFDRHT